MVQFKKISQNPKKTLTVEKFGGVDFTSPPGRVSYSRSTDAVNMIRDSLGKVKKRFGYRQIYKFDECIYGIFTYTTGIEKKRVVHSGDKLYIETQEGYDVIFENLNRKNSQGVQMGDKLVVADGKKLLYYDGEKAGYIEDIAYTPTVAVGRSPAGGGTFLDPVNLLNTKRIEKFRSTGDRYVYQLTSQNIDQILSIRFKIGEAQWRDYLAEGRYYWVDSYNGTLKLDLLLEASEEDNLVVEYTVKRNEDNFNAVNTASFLTLYGAYGAMDRLFLGGNSVYPNRDFYSELNDPTFFPDTNYGVFGKTESPIVGYSHISDNLCVHKNNETGNVNMILRYGTVSDEGDVIFKVTGTCMGDGAVSKEGFSHLDNEPAYVSTSGICAITPSDIIGERISQKRSYYIDGKMLDEVDFKNASAVSYKGFLMVLMGDKIYILDSQCPSVDELNIYSHRQYEAYVWEIIPSNILFTDGENLVFGGKNGELCMFYNSDEEENCYLDNQKPVEAYWQFPQFIGDDFTKKKTVMQISVLFDDYSKNTKIQYKNLSGEWVDAAFKDGNRMFLSKRLHIKNSTGAEIRMINTEDEAMKINTVKISYMNNGKIK